MKLKIDLNQKLFNLIENLTLNELTFVQLCWSNIRGVILLTEWSQTLMLFVKTAQKIITKFIKHKKKLITNLVLTKYVVIIKFL